MPAPSALNYARLASHTRAFLRSTIQLVPDPGEPPAAMIAFGSAITDGAMYERCAEPGILLAAEPDSLILPTQTTGSLYRNYNLMFDLAAENDDLEALVLVHQDAELVDPNFCSVVREAFADPEVALGGLAGSLGVRSIAWWEAAVTWASFSHRYTEYGGGEVESISFIAEKTPHFAQTGVVDSVDGFVMVFSPWAVRNLRFDENLGNLHGYDFDICCQVREAGRKVVTLNTRAVHHHSLQLVSNVETWIEAHVQLTEKWEGRLPGVGAGGDDWKKRARYAEASASAAKTLAASDALKREAVTEEIARMRETLSWRITRPLRWLGNLLKKG